MNSTIDKIQMVLNLFEGEIVMDNIGKERVDTAVRNILSGQNNCSTLAKAAASGNGQYFYNAIAPVAAVYASELKDMAKQRDYYSADSESKRFALESIISNMSPKAFPPSVVDAILKAMPGKVWK